MQVCKRWRAVAARNLQTLRPAMLKMHVFVRVFPSLTVLDLSGALRHGVSVLPATLLGLPGSATYHRSEKFQQPDWS